MLQLLIAVIALVLHSCNANEIVAINLIGQYPFRPNDQVFVRGDNCGLSWDRGSQMQCNGSSATIILQCPPSTQISIKLLLNDQVWMRGANAVFDSSSGGGTIEVFPWFYTNEGRYEVFSSFYSPELNNTRSVAVYFPPSYSENPKKTNYEVLIMHDGQNLFNASTSFLGIAWDCQDTLNQLIIEGVTDEVLIIAPYNTDDRTNEYTYSYDPSEQTGGKGDLYLDFIFDSLLPEIKKRGIVRLPVTSQPISMLGSSLGGLISCYAGWTRGERLSKVGCMSSSFWWNNQDFLNNIMQAGSTSSAIFYLDSGTEGPGADDEAETKAVLRKMENKYNFVLNSSVFYYLDEGGYHNEKYWGERFHIPMENFFLWG